MRHFVIFPAAALALALAGVVFGLVSGTAAAGQGLPYRGEGPIFIDPADLEWKDVASMAPPAEIAVIEGDLSAEEPFTIRLSLPAGYRIEPHVHPAYERVTVISGMLHFAHGEEFDADATRPLPAGSIAIMPPGEPMYGYVEENTVIQLHGVGPWGIEYLDPANDPRG